MKKIITIFLIGLFFTIPNVVKARSFLCDQSDLIKLQKIASNVTTTYEHAEYFPPDQKYGIVKFVVTISNLDPRIYIRDINSNIVYKTNDKQIIISNVDPGTTLELTIYGNDYGCNEEELVTKYVNIPNYNKYYKSEICERYPNNRLCNKWTLVNYSYEDFRQRVLKSEYVEEEKGENLPPIKSFQEYFVELINFLDKYKFIIFVPIIVVSISGIIILKLLGRRKEFDLK